MLFRTTTVWPLALFTIWYGSNVLLCVSEVVPDKISKIELIPGMVFGSRICSSPRFWCCDVFQSRRYKRSRSWSNGFGWTPKVERLLHCPATEILEAPPSWEHCRRKYAATVVALDIDWSHFRIQEHMKTQMNMLTGYGSVSKQSPMVSICIIPSILHQLFSIFQPARKDSTPPRPIG